MKTKSYNVYSFAELSSKARERAIEKVREFVSQDWDGEDSIINAKQAFAHAGFDIKTIHYSGFSCQGDGASFTGSWKASDVNAKNMREYAPVDKTLHRIADDFAAIAKAFPEASFKVNQSGRYMHEYYTDFSVELYEDARIDWTSEAVKIEEHLIQLARDAMRWTYRQLEKEYDFAMADPQIIENIEANDYEFTEDGKID